MPDEQLRLTTAEQREHFFLARRLGDMCAACGRMLSEDEILYIERFTRPGSEKTRHPVGPVGVECASAELRRRTAGVEPERCTWCGRRMYYWADRSWRLRPFCSKYCSSRYKDRRRTAKAKE